MWLITTDEIRRGHEIAGALAILVLVMGVWRLYAIMTGDGPGPDQLLFGDAMLHTGDGRHNRMSFNAAHQLLRCQAPRCSCSSGDHDSPAAFAQLLAVLVLFSAQAALIAHAYQSGWFESIGAFNRMALPTAVGFAALSVAVMTLSSREGLIAIILSEGPGGSLARTLLPAGFLRADGARVDPHLRGAVAASWTLTLPTRCSCSRRSSSSCRSWRGWRPSSTKATWSD